MDFLVNLDVDDLERGIDFYVQAFGLEVGRRFGDDVSPIEYERRYFQSLTGV